MLSKKIVSSEIKKLTIDQLYQDLEVDSDGLSLQEANRRSHIFGYNNLSKSKKIGPIRQFLSYFKNPLIIILMVAALISGFTGQSRSMLIILIMIFLSVIMNFYQERKSGRAAEKIASRLAINAKVWRKNEEQRVDTKYIVPGDIVLLTAGDIVPADGKLISADDFFINESSLTGESFPVEKDEKRDNVVFSGTNVVSGFGKFLVVNTGANTEFGQIAKKLVARPQENSFEKGINQFGFLIIRVIAIIVSLIFFINALLHKGLFDSFLFALAVAVGVTPELLPMIMSVNMSKGAIRMSKHGVLVKRLNSIPTFGSLDVLCTDKTGTLTQDKITVIKHVDINGVDSEEVFRDAYINGALETGIKNLLDQAILNYKKLDVSAYKKTEEIPYDFNRKRSSIVYIKDGQTTMITKGAPEEMFKICNQYLDGGKVKKITPLKLKQAIALYERLSEDGLRLLAIAYKDITTVKEKYKSEDENDLIFRGFMAFYDPPKDDVKETLVFMKEHGVAIKILTGDSPLVTKKICSDLGLEVKGIVTGAELNLNILGDEEIYQKIKDATIVARLSPSQKEKIIMELKRHGLIVGYLGDGINDAPSLKAADVGISVENAVDVAKETADIILTQKGLKELMSGIIEGRKTFGNTMKYLLMGLSSNFGNMFSMIGASLFLPFFPMTASQILLNNFIYDGSQLAIPSDNVDQEYLKKPKHWNIGFIKKYMLVFGPISSIFDFLTFFLLYSVFHLNVATFQAGWFIESLATQILVIHIIRTQKIPFIQSRPSWPLLITTLAAVFLGFALTQKGIGTFFGFSPLPWPALLLIVVLVIIYLIIMEFVKRIFYSYTAIKN